MRKKRSGKIEIIDEQSYLAGKRKGAILKIYVVREGSQVTRYSLAYINAKVASADNGRVLGYDNAHGHHHRHFMGTVSEIEEADYEAIAARFERELKEMWRREDA